MPSVSISGGAVRCRNNQALQFYIGNASDAGQETELASSGSPMRYGWDMHFLTSLIIVVGFAFVVCLGLVKTIWDLSQLSFHEAPVIRVVSRISYFIQRWYEHFSSQDLACNGRRGSGVR